MSEINLRRELIATIEIFGIQLAAYSVLGFLVGVALAVALFALARLFEGLSYVSLALYHYVDDHTLTICVVGAALGVVYFAFTAGPENIARYRFIRDKQKL